MENPRVEPLRVTVPLDKCHFMYGISLRSQQPYWHFPRLKSAIVAYTALLPNFSETEDGGCHYIAFALFNASGQMPRQPAACGRNVGETKTIEPTGPED
jgi:hypothetical protein